MTTTFPEFWSSWEEFIYERSTGSWLFRGVANDEFKLVPKVGRDSVGQHREDLEIRIFETFKKRGREFVRLSELGEWDWLSLAQHHGLPTRLLDWTSNPLVALYFSVASVPVDKNGLIYAVNTSTLAQIDPKADDPFVVQSVSTYRPSSVVPRIVAQKGFFTVHPMPYAPWEPATATSASMVVPVGLKPLIKQRLFALGVDQSTIMPDLDGLCGQLAWLYREQYSGVDIT
ncbi:FRG domain-containing protein [Thalassobaculum sp.]|uniref:FRG domain-containing protein n=1 Tax=Thalassobaculum sp. TaxID=2022740 RepID=UPI0032EC0192